MTTLPRRTLTIMRHAKSSWRDPTLDDFDRPLNKRGRRDAPMMGRRLRALGVQPSLIIASPAVRALTTAQAVAAELGYPRQRLQTEDSLYHASLRTLLKVIGRQPAEHAVLMLFGHNPGLNELVDYLVPGLTENLPTAGVVSVDVEGPDWVIADDPRVELLLHAWPKQEGTA